MAQQTMAEAYEVVFSTDQRRQDKTGGGSGKRVKREYF
jgi:hypothetical protein